MDQKPRPVRRTDGRGAGGTIDLRPQANPPRTRLQPTAPPAYAPEPPASPSPKARRFRKAAPVAVAAPPVAAPAPRPYPPQAPMRPSGAARQGLARAQAQPAAAPPAHRTARPTQAAMPKAQPVNQQEPPARDSLWRVILQFVIGVAIIVLVAFGIVFLYVKYYQG